jgi:F0F1-type ATP synthase assembly protein I
MPGENDDPLNMPNDDEAFDRFKKIRAELEAMELPELPVDELEARKAAIANIPSGLPEVPKLEDVRTNAWAGKERHDNVKAETERRHEQDKKSAQGLGSGLMVAYLIMGFPFLGIAIGWVLDLTLKSNIFKGIGVLIGMTLGVVCTVTYLNNSDKNK